MRKTLFAALLVGLITIGAAATASAQTTPAPASTPAAAPAPTPDEPEAATALPERPMRTPGREEIKRRQKVRKRTGPVVYKGRIAEQSEFLTDTDDNGKDADKSGKKPRKMKRRKN